MKLKKKNPYYHNFMQVVQVLFETANRSDAEEENLSESAYDALEIIVASSPDRTIDDLQKIVQVVFQGLDVTLGQTPLGIDEIVAKNLKISHLISLLQVLNERIREDIEPYADKIVTYALTVIQSKTDTSVHDEVFLMIGGFINIIEKKFERYVEVFFPFLCTAMKEYKFKDTCVTATHVAGDITRALEGDVLPYSDTIVTICLELLMVPNIDINIKTSILSLFGDISMAIQENFEKYLHYVLPIFKSACEEIIVKPLDINDEDDMDMIHAVFIGLCEGIQGLLQGVGSHESEALKPYMDTFIKLLAYISEDETKEENISRGCVGLIGDMLSVYEEEILPLLRQPFVERLINFTEKQATDQFTFETVEYAREKFNQYRGQ